MTTCCPCGTTAKLGAQRNLKSGNATHGCDAVGLERSGFLQDITCGRNRIQEGESIPGIAARTGFLRRILLGESQLLFHLQLPQRNLLTAARNDSTRESKTEFFHPT